MPQTLCNAASVEWTSTIWTDWSAGTGTAVMTTNVACNGSGNTWWPGWVQASGASTTNVWYDWARDAYSTAGIASQAFPAVGDVAAREERQARDDRARAILAAYLTEEQRAQLARDKFFVVRGSKGRLFEIRHGRVQNVTLLGPDGKAVVRLCAHPSLAVPDGDTMLAQKLLLETDEEEFYRIANKVRAA
jgi:hypothetical protein